VYVFDPDEAAALAQLTQTELVVSLTYPVLHVNPVMAFALETLHVAKPALAPVYPVAPVVHETQTLLVESRAYPALHAEQTVGVAAAHEAQLEIPAVHPVPVHKTDAGKENPELQVAQTS
jgi:hypothetical protein